ncbi:MAG: ThiF family adenylyltransferase [Candidatus Gastranaerophilales bacterium]|nr:ThiF family adenylyltransferase [Candidatus Gastranaerophilales bacterium]
MKYADNALFFNSALLFSEKSMDKLAKSKVAIAGIGGVGSIIAEMLARNGIGFLKLAEPDPYEDKNLNRQLFATLETIGINKAQAGAERIKIINPNCNIKVYDTGVTLSNVRDFVQDVDVLLVQTDTESSKILLHRVAKEYNIPLVCGSRGSIQGHRWFVRAKVWDYKKYPNMPCYDETNHPDFIGIPLEEMTQESLKAYDEMIKIKKMNIFTEYAKSKPEMFGSITQEDLIERIDTSHNFSNRHVCSVLANTGGCLAATATLRVLLGGPEGDLEINLWEGNQKTAKISELSSIETYSS